MPDLETVVREDGSDMQGSEDRDGTMDLDDTPMQPLNGTGGDEEENGQDGQRTASGQGGRPTGPGQGGRPTASGQGNVAQLVQQANDLVEDRSEGDLEDDENGGIDSTTIDSNNNNNSNNNNINNTTNDTANSTPPDPIVGTGSGAPSGSTVGTDNNAPPGSTVGTGSGAPSGSTVGTDNNTPPGPTVGTDNNTPPGSTVGTDNSTNNQQLITDDVNSPVLNMGINTLGENPHQEEVQEDAGRAFDTLKDLDDLKAAQKEAEDSSGNDATDSGINDTSGQAGTPENTSGQPNTEESEEEKQEKERKRLEGRIHEARLGNLYRAVIHARMIEKGEKPAGDGNAAGGNKPSRMSRFFNSSKMNRFLNSKKLDKAANIGKIVGATSGIAGAFDEGYKNSGVANAISLVTSMVALVSSVRTIVKKLKGWNKQASKTNKMLSAISLIGDFATAAAKGCAIAQAIEAFVTSEKNLFKKIMSHVMTLLGMIAQISGLIGGSVQLKNLLKKHREMENERKKQDRYFIAIVKHYTALEEQEQGNTEVGSAAEGETGAGDGTHADDNAVVNGGSNTNSEDGSDVSEESVEDRSTGVDESSIANNGTRVGGGSVEGRSTGVDESSDTDREIGTENGTRVPPSAVGLRTDSAERQVNTASAPTTQNSTDNTRQQENIEGAPSTQKPPKEKKPRKGIRQRVKEHKELSAKAKTLVPRVLKILERDDLQDWHRSYLISGLALRRRMDKNYDAFLGTATGLMTTAIGMGSSIATGVTFGVTADENSTEEQKAKAASAATGAKVMGATANIGILGSMVVSHALKKHGIKREQEGKDEKETVRESLWGSLAQT